MNENVENLMIEHLRAIRSDMHKMADSMNRLKAEMTAIRAHMHGVQTLQEHDHGDVADIKLRLDRIEQRLDLVD